MAWFFYAHHKLWTLTNKSFDGFGQEVSAIGELATGSSDIFGGFNLSSGIFEGCGLLRLASVTRVCVT